MMPFKHEKRQAYHTKYLRERYRNDPVYRAKHLKTVAAANRRKKEEIEQMISEFRKNGCSRCPEREPCCLVAHHVNPSQKEILVSRSKSRTNPKRVAKELAKCLCLCMNCHAKLHVRELVGREGLEPPADEDMSSVL